MLKHENQTALELAKEPPKKIKLKHRDRYLEILDAAAHQSAAGR